MLKKRYVSYFAPAGSTVLTTSGTSSSCICLYTFSDGDDDDDEAIPFGKNRLAVYYFYREFAEGNERNMQRWLALATYEDWRYSLIDKAHIDSGRIVTFSLGDVHGVKGVKGDIGTLEKIWDLGLAPIRFRSRDR